jgi:hypothetical protein
MNKNVTNNNLRLSLYSINLALAAAFFDCNFSTCVLPDIGHQKSLLALSLPGMALYDVKTFLLYPECKMDYRPCVLFRYNEYRDK